MYNFNKKKWFEQGESLTVRLNARQRNKINNKDALLEAGLSAHVSVYGSSIRRFQLRLY